MNNKNHFHNMLWVHGSWVLVLCSVVKGEIMTCAGSSAKLTRNYFFTIFSQLTSLNLKGKLTQRYMNMHSFYFGGNAGTVIILIYIFYFLYLLLLLYNY